MVITVYWTSDSSVEGFCGDAYVCCVPLYLLVFDFKKKTIHYTWCSLDINIDNHGPNFRSWVTTKLTIS